MKQLFLAALFGSCLTHTNPDIDTITSMLIPQQSQDLANIIPLTESDLNVLVTTTQCSLLAKRDAFITLSLDTNSAQSILRAFDHLMKPAKQLMRMLETVAYVHTDKAIRDLAYAQSTACTNFIIDEIDNCLPIYKLVEKAAMQAMQDDTLDSEIRYFAQESLRSIQTQGLLKEGQEREHLNNLNKKIDMLCLAFSRNIAEDSSCLYTSQDALAGCDPVMINALPRNELGQVCVGLDYPTYFQVMENCSVESTRQQLWQLMANRAYPVNDAILKDLISTRSELARALDFGDGIDVRV